MITVYGFGRVNPKVIGETRDLRVEWALEETELPYTIKPLDHTAGELDGPEYSQIAPFNQIPVIDDQGFVISESGAILLYIADKSGKLMPIDPQGRARVAQWCLAALNTVEMPLMGIFFNDAFGDGKQAKSREGMVKVVDRHFSNLERRLDGREWIASDEFSVADILLAHVLRGARKQDFIEPYPKLKAYRDRAFARPAWRRAVARYAEALNADPAQID
jgi:glutathione S-transferase